MTDPTTTTTPTPPEGLTDEQLLELAAAAIGYDSIEPGEYEEKSGSTVHAYGSELIAYGRAAIAAHEAARPTPAPAPPTAPQHHGATVGHSYQDYALIVPGQPWAPISVTPGPYQP